MNTVDMLNNIQDGIKTIISQFIREETGNRLSHFASLALESTIIAELKKLDALKEELLKKEEQWPNTQAKP